MRSSACARARSRELPAGANVGTASLRRQAQTLFARPDLGVVTLRGNVDTRLAKLEAGAADATFLALAGLKRLGLEARATSLVDPQEAPPAACQGALAITARADDARDAAPCSRRSKTPMRAWKSRPNARFWKRSTVRAARRSRRWRASKAARFRFIGEALTPDGTARWRRTEAITLGGDPVQEARALGLALGREIRAEAGDAIVMDGEDDIRRKQRDRSFRGAAERRSGTQGTASGARLRSPGFRIRRCARAPE